MFECSLSRNGIMLIMLIFWITPVPLFCDYTPAYLHVGYFTCRILIYIHQSGTHTSCAPPRHRAV